MRYAFLTRPFNRIGYDILKFLLEETEFPPIALFEYGNRAPMTSQEIAYARAEYFREVAYYGAKPLRCFNSPAILAAHHGVPVHVVSDINAPDVRNILSAFRLDVLLVGGGWPRLISQSTTQCAAIAAVNVHPSLLPDFPGTDIHRWQVYAGVRTSGISLHLLHDDYDSGKILEQQAIHLPDNMTPQSLAQQIGKSSGETVRRTLRGLASSSYSTNPPNAPLRHPSAAPFPRWPWNKNAFLHINWCNSARDIEQLVRASAQQSYKYNGPFFIFSGSRVIVREAALEPWHFATSPGQVLDVSECGILVGCGVPGAAIRLHILQPGTATGWPHQPNISPSFSALNWAKKNRLKAPQNLSDEPK